jgi:ubiquinone biosynthesis protein COQ9
MTAQRRPRIDDDAASRAVLEAALPHVPFDGFSDKVLRRAGKEAHIGKDRLVRLFPQGPLSLVEAYSVIADADMEAKLASLELGKMKVRERIATAVKTRIAVLRSHKEAARRAAAFLSLPPHLPLGTRLLYGTVDCMWRAVGDKSTDFNFYTKRAILSAVYATTLMRWFNDQSEGESETWAFLADRIENVMQFEKFKAEMRTRFSQVPTPWAILDNLAHKH